MIAQADAIKIPLPNQSVHTCVTSPPYWGLRKYAGSQGRIWGGDPECGHEWGAFTTDPVRPVNRRCEKCQKFGVSIRTTEDNVEIHCSDCNHITYTTSDTRGIVGIKGKKPAMSNLKALEYETIKQGQFCQLCAAWYGSLGLEPTPEQHIENIVEICREVRRVLRDDGVLWLNYGDCYDSGTSAERKTSDGNVGAWQTPTAVRGHQRVKGGTTAGNLMLMPHRVALALQQDGWIIRQDLVWFKRNPMPESVNGWRWQRERTKTATLRTRSKDTAGEPQRMGPEDEYGPFAEYEYGDDLELKRGSWRHTRAHEYIFMLCKSMQYWSNQEAVREASDPAQEAHNRRYAKNYDNAQRIAGGQPDNVNNAGIHERPGPGGRNPRSVLDVPTQPYSGAHYATFPVKLIAPLIRATCPRWACPVCGQGWAAIIEKPQLEYEERLDLATERTSDELIHTGFRKDGKRTTSGQAYQNWRDENPAQVKGYRPTCEHPHTQEEAVPGICFDPFVGSGTTVKVAQDLLRRGIGIDISMEYLDHQAKVRAGLGTPSNALEDLPLFENLLE